MSAHQERIAVAIAMMMSSPEQVHPIDVVCMRCHSDVGKPCTEHVKPMPWQRDTSTVPERGA